MGKAVICDFCSSPDVKWRYPARTFRMEEEKLESVTDWAACEKCHQLIEKKKDNELARRSAETDPMVRLGVVPTLEMVAFIMKLHNEFRSHRCGNAVKLKDC